MSRHAAYFRQLIFHMFTIFCRLRIRCFFSLRLRVADFMLMLPLPLPYLRYAADYAYFAPRAIAAIITRFRYAIFATLLHASMMIMICCSRFFALSYAHQQAAFIAADAAAAATIIFSFRFSRRGFAFASGAFDTAIIFVILLMLMPSRF